MFIYIFSRRFYPKRLQVHSGFTCFFKYVCSWGIEPTTFCAANTMLHHWATVTPCTQSLIGACLARTPASVRCGMEAISRRHCWGTIESSAHLDCWIDCFSSFSWKYPIDSRWGSGQSEPILDFWGPYAKLLLMNEPHFSVFHSVSNRKRSRNVSFPRLAMLSTRFFMSRARDITTFTLHDLTDFYVEMATAPHYNKL